MTCNQTTEWKNIGESQWRNIGPTSPSRWPLFTSRSCWYLKPLFYGEWKLLTGSSPEHCWCCQQPLSRKCPGFGPINGSFQQAHTSAARAMWTQCDSHLPCKPKRTDTVLLAAFNSKKKKKRECDLVSFTRFIWLHHLHPACELIGFTVSDKQTRLQTLRVNTLAC